ncbi:MAG TPA: DUF1269 domain-containing protein [Propionibacteriaceae bacterium]|nr:DUF1269 domain-containing protein [Propionibacteriaceae bacterium]
MAENEEAPHDLYIAAYGDGSVAEEAWNAVRLLAADKVIEVDALALVNRDSDGKIHVKDISHETGIGATIGAVGGALVGLIFPPSLLATAALGGAIGAGTGAVVDRVIKRQIKADVESTLPTGGSGILVIFDEQWVDQVEQALRNADTIKRDHLHDDDREETS